MDCKRLSGGDRSILHHDNTWDAACEQMACTRIRGDGCGWVRALKLPKTEQFSVAVVESRCISRNGKKCEVSETF